MDSEAEAPAVRGTRRAPRDSQTAAIELGASNGQAMVKKPGGQWELVR
jgi:hypothetical protein